MNQISRKSTLCFRIDAEELRAIDAIAAAKYCQRSDWLRTVIYAAVRAECLAMVSESAKGKTE
jgi:hypothetical protein